MCVSDISFCWVGNVLLTCHSLYKLDYYKIANFKKKSSISSHHGPKIGMQLNGVLCLGFNETSSESIWSFLNLLSSLYILCFCKSVCAMSCNVVEFEFWIVYDNIPKKKTLKNRLEFLLKEKQKKKLRLFWVEACNLWIFLIRLKRRTSKYIFAKS